MDFNTLLPDEYNKNNFITSFSGGKDSTALLILLLKELKIDPERVNPVFANTGYENEHTYAYLDYLECKLDIKINRVQGKTGQLFKSSKKLVKAIEEGRMNNTEDPLTMERLCIAKKRFPGTVVKFCTTELKLIPLRKFIHKFEGNKKPIIVCGIRKDESTARKDRKEWSYDRYMERTSWMPLVDWTAEDVFNLHKKWGVEPNPLYKEGMKRVGCFPCVNCVKPELANIATRYPEAFDRVQEMEDKVNKVSNRGIATMYPNDKTPKRYHSGYEEGTGITYNTALDVKAWALGQNPRILAQLELDIDGDEFENFEGPACQSHYGLCE